MICPEKFAIAAIHASPAALDQVADIRTQLTVAVPVLCNLYRTKDDAGDFPLGGTDEITVECLQRSHIDDCGSIRSCQHDGTNRSASGHYGGKLFRFPPSCSGTMIGGDREGEGAPFTKVSADRDPIGAVRCDAVHDDAAPVMNKRLVAG